MTNSKVFDAMEKDAILSRVRTFAITHPKKDGHASINIVYPKDGAGRLKAFCIDSFGDRPIAQSGYAGGHGYDKAGAAMSGFVIDGKTITDHCAQDATSAQLLKRMTKVIDDDTKRRALSDKARKIGYDFANGCTLCYKMQGLDYLRALGYRVIQVN